MRSPVTCGSGIGQSGVDHARSIVGAGHSLADTAFACGFSDQSHMTRQFKRAYGLTPSRWRAIRIASGKPNTRCYGWPIHLRPCTSSTR
jgi:AraC-like DNA-binding protein